MVESKELGSENCHVSKRGHGTRKTPMFNILKGPKNARSYPKFGTRQPTYCSLQSFTVL